MTQVLVAYDTRFGSTGEVARAIADVLEARGHRTDVRHVDHTPGDLGGYGAFVLGSPLYSRRWLTRARRFLKRHRSELATRPVWYFALGIRMPGGPQPNPTQVARLKRAAVRLGGGLEPRSWGLFPGRLDPTIVGFKERVQLRVFKPQAGDFRDWDAIRGWAADVADTLDAETTPSAT